MTFRLNNVMLVAAAALVTLVVPQDSLEARSREQQQASTRGLYLDLIRQARSDGRPRAAIAFLDDFDRQHPSDVEAIVLRINCLLDLNEAAEADAVARRLPKTARAGQLGADAARGHISVAMERWNEAVLHYRLALAAKPADANLFNALGYAQIRAGSARDAIETLRSASELAPDSEVIRNNLLLALLLGGEVQAVRDALSRIPDETQRAALDARLRNEGEAVARELAATVRTSATQGETS
jgi:Flp pilus assembly protein TadD